METNNTPNIAAKLCAVARDCGYVQKDGANGFHKYRYASAAAILAHVNPSLARHGVAVVGTNPTILSERGEGKERVVTVRMEVTVADVESGERATFAGLGSGQDAGDKAVMKAQTAATKYAWMVALSISTGDDPEADEDTDERAAGKGARAPQPPTERELTAMAAMLRGASTLDALKAAWSDLQDELARATEEQRAALARVKDARKAELQRPPPDGTTGGRPARSGAASASGPTVVATGTTSGPTSLAGSLAAHLAAKPHARIGDPRAKTRELSEVANSYLKRRAELAAAGCADEALDVVRAELRARGCADPDALLWGVAERVHRSTNATTVPRKAA